MRVNVGLENNIEGRSLAWALEHPGCFAYGPDASSAVVAMAQAIPAYIAWMESHTPNPWFKPAEVDIHLVEVWEGYQINDQYERVASGYEVNAWFSADWKPLTAQEVERGRQLLAWTRSDLLSFTTGLDDDQLELKASEDSWSVRRIISHVGTADWWYLDRLSLTDCSRELLPREPFEKLKTTRSRLEQVLPSLINVERVSGKEGEFWSPRKLLRRAVWHEMDHIIHIREVLAQNRGLS